MKGDFMAEENNQKNSNATQYEDGQSLAKSISISRRKPIQIAHDFELPKVRVRPADTDVEVYRCCMCGKGYPKQRGNFPVAGKSMLWKGNNSFLPFCKTCVDILMKTLTDFYSGNEEHALRHLCCIFDWCYNETASAMSATGSVRCNVSRATSYSTKLGTTPSRARGETFLDTIKAEVEERDSINEATLMTDEEEEKLSDFVVTNEMIRAWGKGFSADQYEYLEEQYQDWITKNVCKTKAQEELFRNIALAQLDVRVTRQKGGKVTEAQKVLQDLMNSANILPKQNSDNILGETQTFGTLLKKIEETRPLPEPDPMWEDVDGIKQYVDTWFYGHLSKALGIKNDCADEYDKEIRKYTVERPSDEELQQESELVKLFDSTVSNNESDSLPENEGGGLA